MKPVLLIVDDEESVRESFRLALGDEYELLYAPDAQTTLRILKDQTFHLCLLDIMLPDGSGLDLLRQIKRRDPSIDVIMVTALQGVDTGLNAMKGEAQDYITKPFKIAQLRDLIQKVLARRFHPGNLLLQGEFHAQKSLCLMGTSQVAQDLIEKIRTLACVDTPICLMGPEGSGTEEIAREIHRSSDRENQPFVTLDCGSFSPQQLKIELMGESRKPRLSQVGKLEFAQGGTLFLKQIDRMPLIIQEEFTTLFLSQNMVFEKKGVRMPLDVRVMSSCEKRLLPPAMKKCFFDGFYRFFIQRHIFSVPSLQERKEDIPMLIDYLLQIMCLKDKTRVKTIQKEVVQLLTEYAWPGNFHELEKCMEIMLLFADQDTLTVEDIPMDVLIKAGNQAQTQQLSIKRVWSQFERKYIVKVLERTSGNQTASAKWLGIHRITLVERLKQLNLLEDYRKIIHKRKRRKLDLRGA